MLRPMLTNLRTGLVLYALSCCFPCAGSAASATGSADYQIGVDDVLQVIVRPRADLNAQAVVLADGTISLPSLGAVKAGGRTVSQLSQDLTRRFGLYDRDITQVAVTVLAYNSRKVFVLGEVVKPGRYSFPVIPGLWDVVREGGGPTAEADLSAVQVIRGEGEKRATQTVDLGSAIASGDFSGLPRLRPGDTVRVPRLLGAVLPKDQVYVMGAVRGPGVYSTQNAPDLVAALMAAGGPGQDADLSRVTLTRRSGASSRTVQLDLDGYLDGDHSDMDLALKPGDTIRVPARGGGFLKGIVSLNTVLPVFQAIVSSVIAIESIRIARGQ